jgi:hypothetical protein
VSGPESAADREKIQALVDPEGLARATRLER